MNQQYPTTFIQQPSSLPSQIYNQRTVHQQRVQLQYAQQQEQQQSYLYQIQMDQHKRFLEQQNKIKQSEERPDFSDMQGGQPPNKPWMGDDVYMVAFLLSVELERLREENTQLMNYFEANEAKFRSLELIESELVQTRQRVGEQEKRIALLQNDCEQWKTKYQNRERESEDARYQNELQRRVLIDREIRELTARFITDRNQLEQENKQLRQELDTLKLKRSSVDDVLQRAEATQLENQKLKQELDNLRRGFDELEYVLKTAADLEQENTILKQQLENRQDFSKGKVAPQLLTSKANLAQSQLGASQYEKELKMLRDENQQMKIKLQLLGQNVPRGAP